MRIEEIDIKKITNRENIRQIEDEESFVSLMKSIKDNGLLQPIGVVLERKKPVIIWGNRRFKACEKLGWKSIPAVIFKETEKITEKEFLIINAIENLQRKQNSLFELGRICKYLKEEENLSIGEISARLSLPRTRIGSALIEIERIPPEIQKRVKIMNGDIEKKGDIPMVTAVAIGRLYGVSEEDKLKLYELVSKEELTSREIGVCGSLMKQGKSLKEIIQIFKKFKPINITFFVNLEKFNKIKEIESKNNIEILSYAINKVFPDLVVKDISRG